MYLTIISVCWVFYDHSIGGNAKFITNFRLSLAQVNSLRPRSNKRHFADDIFKRIFLNENQWISPRISLKFVPKVRINNIPALVQKMAWRRPGDKPLSEPMVVSLTTHICVTRPQWVKWNFVGRFLDLQQGPCSNRQLAMVRCSGQYCQVLVPKQFPTRAPFY